MGQTKYSRQTWRKSTLSSNMNTPRLGSKGCSLCTDKSIPENLNAHVNDSQTCADVHLQLAMLRYDNAMCAVGQEKYEELCCTVESSSTLKSTLAFMIGAVVAGFFLKKVITNRKCRRIIEQEKEMIDDIEELPGTVSFNSRGSSSRGSSSRSGNRSDNAVLEMLSASYIKMEDQRTKTKTPRSSRRPQSRSRPREKTSYIKMEDPKTKTRTPRSSRRPLSRSRSRPKSRSRPREITETRSKSRTRPREVMSENRSGDRPMSRSRDRPNRSRTGRSRSRSKSRARSRPQFQEVDLCNDNGPVLPTQVV